MKNIVAIPRTNLFSLNTFDVGHNPIHVDLGLMKHQYIEEMSSFIHLIKEADILTLSGLGIEMLYEEAPEILDELKALVQQSSLKIAATPYYNTRLELLDSQQFIEEWQATQKLIKEHLGVSADFLYLGNQAVPKPLSSSLSGLKLSCIGTNSLDIIHKQLSESFDQDEVPAAYLHSAFHYPRQQNSFEEHINKELNTILPFIVKDQELHRTWRLLGNDEVMSRLNGHDPQETYESYFNVMHILNDIAHTVRAIELTKKGEFEHEPQIVESPSARILEVVSGVNNHA